MAKSGIGIARRIVAVIALALGIAMTGFCETVTNVRGVQRENSNLVDIYYDLNATDGGTYTVEVAIEGRTTEVTATTFSGDVGDSVTPGTGRHVVWDAGADWLNKKGEVKVTITTAKNDGRGKVQLWAGGPYWADRNVGADKPEDYGLYFCWGDTTGHHAGYDFSNDNSAIYTWNKSVSELQSAGWLTSGGVLAPSHDAAHVKWGGAWRMPTYQELSDLISKCDWTWDSINGVNGYIVRGRGDYASKSIFLPAAGYGSGTSLYSAGSIGLYFSSVPYSDYSGAFGLYFYSGDRNADGYGRGGGQSVRPVQGFTNAVTAHGATGSSGWFYVDATDGYVVRLHGNGAWTADGRDVVEQFFVVDQYQDLVKEPFGKTRGSNLFLGWKIGNANFDWTDDNKNAIKNLIGDGKSRVFNEAYFASLMEGGYAYIEEDGRKVIDLYAIWTKSLCVKFYDPTDNANTPAAAEFGQTSELQPSYLLDHMWWRWNEEDPEVWHRSGETVEVWPGKNLVGFKVLSRYRKIVDIVPDYTNIVVRSNDGSDLQPVGSQTIAQTLCVPVKGEMSKWGTVEFRCSVAEGVDATGVEPFDTSKITANIRKKYSNGTDDVWTEWIDTFPVKDRICLPPGEYVVGFSYDGGWHEVFPALGSFTLPTGATSYFDTVIKDVRFEPDGSSVNGDYQYEDGTLRLSASFDYISAYYFVGLDDLEEIIFEGDAPIVEAGALDQVPSNCTVRVSRSSTGWGVDIPGTWKGLRIEYLEEDEPEGSPVEFTVVDGVLTHVELNGATEVVIPDGVTSIGEDAFAGCYALTIVTIPGSVKSIGEYAFYGCNALTNVTIPDSVKSIGDYAFYGRENLKSLALPGSIDTIGEHAFARCCRLETVTGLREDIEVGAHAFSGTPFNENRPFKLDVRDGVLVGMQGMCPATVTIPNGVTSIAEGVFDCEEYMVPEDEEFTSWRSAVDALEAVFIPASVERIGLYAFYGCESLSRVELANPDVMIDGSAFNECARLTSFDIQKAGFALAGWDGICYEDWSVGEFDQERMEWVSISNFVEGAEIHMGPSIEFMTEGFSVMGSTGEIIDDYGYVWFTAVWEPSGTTVTIGGKDVTIPHEWISTHVSPEVMANSDVVAALESKAANGRRTVGECYALGIDPEDPDDDLKITHFEIENGKPVITLNHTEDGSGNSFTPRVKTLGKANLSDAEWREVPEGGDASLRFFKVVVELP